MMHVVVGLPFCWFGWRYPGLFHVVPKTKPITICAEGIVIENEDPIDRILKAHDARLHKALSNLRGR